MNQQTCAAVVFGQARLCTQIMALGPTLFVGKGVVGGKCVLVSTNVRERKIIKIESIVTIVTYDEKRREEKRR